jgi:hypothetical protein
MPLAETGETAVMDALLVGRFVSLHTGIPPGNEVVGGAYARQPATFVQTSGPDPTIYKNDALIAYPTATGAWGIIAYFGIWSALTGGSLLAYNVVGASKPVDAGDSARWDPNSLTVDTN